jgi:hypothetical protein
MAPSISTQVLIVVGIAISDRSVIEAPKTKSLARVLIAHAIDAFRT